MCAIAGIWTQARGTGARTADAANPHDLDGRVAHMLEIQKHRAPEPNSVWSEGGLTLGHRRLAIIDLSAAGRQPMASRDGRWTIVFNGEIFNYRELRDELSGVFRSATDTEVLLEACAAWGVPQALARANGMFGFALWDGLRRELTLVRDRAGEKPLVYFWDGATLAFASELKALEGFHGHRLNPSAVDAYLALGYVPAPLAIFARCRKLPAGHLIRFRTGETGGPLAVCDRGGRPRSERWWPPDQIPEQTVSVPPPPFADEARARIGEAVRLRLRSDLPVALALSGGVDSSVIAAECVRQGARPEAFTLRFDGDETDFPFARQVAGGLGLRHTVLDAKPATLAERLDEIIFHYDEPFADSSALACFALAEALEGRYRVVLNGDGADEAFGGYRHYEYIGIKQTLKAAVAVAGFCDGARSGRAGVYLQSKSVFSAAERRRLLTPAVARCGPGPSDYRFAVPPWIEEVEFLPREGGMLRCALHLDRQLALANGLTYKMDIALGAFSMEGRAPLLDHAVLDWGPTLPAHALVRRREKKIVLRAAYARELPAEVLNRPKHGFGAPVEHWLRGPFEKAALGLLPCPWFAETGQFGATGQRRWALLMFSAWAARWNAAW